MSANILAPPFTIQTLNVSVQMLLVWKNMKEKKRFKMYIFTYVYWGKQKYP